MKEHKAADILRSARDRLSEPAAWVQGFFAKDAHGDWVRATDPGARCWCDDGAIIAEQGAAGAWPNTMVGGTPSLWLSTAAKALGFPTASLLNDAPHTKHEHVLALFDFAIRLAEAASEVPS